MSISFWVSDPNDLNLIKFWPSSNSTIEENMNSLTILSIYICIILAIAFKSFLPLYICVLIIGIIAIVYYFIYAPKEGYKPIRYPTHQNPFMNIPIPDYDKPQEYNDYYRYKDITYPTPESEKVRNTIEDDFVKGLYQDPAGRLFERNNSQREYISQPVGTVPNNQTEFAQWLYGKDYVCKSGSIWDRYGVKYTPDSLVCNGFNASEPTNFNRLTRIEN